MDRGKRSAAAVASLPDDLLLEILSRLPVKSLCRFKCVSKAWHGLMADPHHRKKLPQTLEGFFLFGSYRGYGNSCWDFVDVIGRSVRPVDACFPFLTELPGIQTISLLHHCNGLLLFGYIKESVRGKSPIYIVSNHATKEWVLVPNTLVTGLPLLSRCLTTSLVFNPASSSHFHLVQIINVFTLQVHIYSSKSGVWSPIGSGWSNSLYTAHAGHSAHVDGMLYVAVHGTMDQIVRMDVEGNKMKTIPVPLRVGDQFRPCSDYIGQSQGRLHYIYHAHQGSEGTPLKEQSYEMFIWVLEDYDANKWVLKDTISFFHLFGKTICRGHNEYNRANNEFNVLGIHPDHNLVFLVQRWDQKLISYDMDSKYVRHLCTLGHRYWDITPYIPYFSALSMLENKH